MRKATASAYPRLPVFIMYALILFLFQYMVVMLNARVSQTMGERFVTPYFSAGLLCNALGYLVFAFWSKRLPTVPAAAVETAAAVGFLAGGMFLSQEYLLVCVCLCMLPLGMLGGFVHLKLAYAIRGDRWGGIHFGCAIAAVVLVQLVIQYLVKSPVAAAVIAAAAAAALFILSLRVPGESQTIEKQKGEKSSPPKMWLTIAVTALLSVAVGINENLLTNVSAAGVLKTTYLPKLIYAGAAVMAGFLADKGNRSLLPLCAAIAMPLITACGVMLRDGGISYLTSFCLFYLLAGFYVVYLSLPFLNAAPKTSNPALCAGGGQIIRGICVSVTTLPLERLLSRLSQTGVLLLMTGFSLAILVLIFIPRSVKAGRRKTVDEQPKLPRGLFTNRENQVLDLILDGSSNKEIAAELYISERTVKFHVTNILAKTDCTSCQVLRERYGGEESFRRQPLER